MNPVEEQLPPPPQAPQPHRISTSCDRHPDEQFTGFCPSCLCERLSVLDQSSSSSAAPTAAGRKSASSAIKSLFRGSAAAKDNGPSDRPTFRSRPGSFLPELRRTKSFSGGKNDGALGFTGIFEPKRKSCDVRVRSTLSSLFNCEHGKRAVAENSTNAAAATSSNFGPGSGVDQVEGKFNNSDSIVIELKEEQESEQEVVLEKEEEHEQERGDGVERVQGEQVHSGEIEEIEEHIVSSNSYSNPNLCSEEQLGEKLEREKVDLKPMKDHIDLDSQNNKVGGKDFKDLAGSLWSAASGFSKKLRSWTRKNKLKKHSGGRTVQVSKKSNATRSYRETQSEIADYGYGRRSCDTDPRFSIDAGRMSLDYGRTSLDYGRISVDAGRMSLDAGRFSTDDPRYSLDEPRASWDGYLIGGGGRPANIPRMNPMVSVVEDPAPTHQPSVRVLREDNQIPLEEPRKSINEEEGMPGGAVQTKDYYLDSSSRRRKSLDRSNSSRTTAAALVAEMDEMKSVTSNTKVNPASVDYLHGASTKGIVGLGGDRELRDSNPISLRDDCLESIDMGFRDSAPVNGSNKGAKKSRSWRSWNIWDLIVKHGSNKDEDDGRYCRANGMDRSYSESWQEVGGEGYGGDPRGVFNRNVFRSNSSASWRNSYGVGTPLGGSMRKSSFKTNGHAKKKSNEFVLERNRSARYSPSNADNSMLRFYLTPMGGSRRGAATKAKPAAYSHAIARSMLRLY